MANFQMEGAANISAGLDGESTALPPPRHLCTMELHSREASKEPCSHCGGHDTLWCVMFRQVAIPFFLFSAINIYAYGWFFNKWTSVGYRGVIAPLLFAVGGIVEGERRY